MKKIAWVTQLRALRIIIYYAVQLAIFLLSSRGHVKDFPPKFHKKMQQSRTMYCVTDYMTAVIPKCQINYSINRIPGLVKSLAFFQATIPLDN